MSLAGEGGDVGAEALQVVRLADEREQFGARNDHGTVAVAVAAEVRQSGDVDAQGAEELVLRLVVDAEREVGDRQRDVALFLAAFAGTPVHSSRAAGDSTFALADRTLELLVAVPDQVQDLLETLVDGALGDLVRLEGQGCVRLVVLGDELAGVVVQEIPDSAAYIGVVDGREEAEAVGVSHERVLSRGRRGCDPWFVRCRRLPGSHGNPRRSRSAWLRSGRVHLRP